jgi:Bacterial Ig-like domain (group 2)
VANTVVRQPPALASFLPARTLTLSPASGSVASGATSAISATARDRDGTVLGHPVFWVSSNTAVATVDGSGIVTGVGVGSGTITAFCDDLVASYSCTVTAAAEPTYTPSIHTSVWSEDFESYADATALKAAYTHNESHGSIALDTTNFHAGAKSLALNFNGDGCLGSFDADVNLEKSFTIGSHRDCISTYWFRFPAGYMHWWSAGGCSRGVGHKEWVLWRPTTPNGQPSGKITFSAVSQNWNTTNNQNPLFFPSATGLLWWVTIQATTATDGWADSTKPSPGTTSMAMVQHLALPGSGSPKDPDSVADGNWHRLTIQMTSESALDAGDGKWFVWIDGVLIMNFDGQDATNFAYQQVYTRDRAWNRVTTMGIFNGGAPQAEARGFDDCQIFYGTSS